MTVHEMGHRCDVVAVETLTGRAWRAECRMCVYVGPFVDRVRAQEFAREHRARMTGKDVRAW